MMNLIFLFCLCCLQQINSAQGQKTQLINTYNRLFLMVTHQYCFHGLVAQTIIDKLKIKYPSITFITTQQNYIAKLYNVTSFPSFIMKKQQNIIKYQFDLEYEQINYWIKVFFQQQFATAPSLQQLAKDAKHQFILVIPNNHQFKGIIKQFVFNYPIFRIYCNSTESSLIKFINLNEQVIMQKSINTINELTSVLNDLSKLNLVFRKFDHKLRMTLINSQKILITLFWDGNYILHQSLSQRYYEQVKKMCLYLNDGNITLGYEIRKQNVKNKVYFLETNINDKKSRKLLQFINIQIKQLPIIVGICFKEGKILKTIFTIDQNYMFDNLFLYWIQNIEHNMLMQDSKMKKVYCPYKKILNQYRYNNLESIQKSIKINKLCKKYNVILQEQKHIWKQSIHYCYQQNIREVTLLQLSQILQSQQL